MNLTICVYDRYCICTKPFCDDCNNPNRLETDTYDTSHTDPTNANGCRACVQQLRAISLWDQCVKRHAISPSS